MQLRMMEWDSVKSMGLLSLHLCLCASQCQRGRSDSVYSLSTIDPHSPCEIDAYMEDVCWNKIFHLIKSSKMILNPGL